MSLLKRGFKAGYSKGFAHGLREGREYYMEPKKGRTTTEFALAAIAAALGGLMSAGVFDDPMVCQADWCGVAAKGIGAVLMLLSVLGYGKLRTDAKRDALIAGVATPKKDDAEGK